MEAKEICLLCRASVLKRSWNLQYFTLPLASSLHCIIISAHSQGNINRLDPVLNIPEYVICALNGRHRCCLSWLLLLSYRFIKDATCGSHTTM